MFRDKNRKAGASSSTLNKRQHCHQAAAARQNNDNSSALIDLTNSPAPQQAKTRSRTSNDNVTYFNFNDGDDDASVSDALTIPAQQLKKRKRVERNKVDEDKVKLKKDGYMILLQRILSGFYDNNVFRGCTHDPSLLDSMRHFNALQVGSLHLSDPHDLHKRMLDAAEKRRLFVLNYLTRDTESSGYNTPLTEKILVELCPELKDCFVQVRRHYNIKQIFVIRYGKNGFHHWHQDRSWNSPHGYIPFLY